MCASKSLLMKLSLFRYSHSIMFHIKPPRTLYIVSDVEYVMKCSVKTQGKGCYNQMLDENRFVFFSFALSETKMKAENKLFGSFYLNWDISVNFSPSPEKLINS